MDPIEHGYALLIGIDVDSVPEWSPPLVTLVAIFVLPT